MGVRLEIRLLGRFEVSRAGVPIPAPAWRRRRPADLLALLALTPGRRLPRQAVFDALWPDKDPAAGANNLHRALYDLRQVLGGRDVDLDHAGVALAGDAWVDAEAMEQAVRAGGLERLRAAVALYRGDLWPEALESPWLLPHRRRLRSLFVEAALRVAWEHAQQGQAAPGIQLLRRLLAADPSNREARLLRDQLLASMGPGAALAEEDGAALAAAMLLGQAHPPPLRGREALVAWLEALLDRGHGAGVLLAEPGAGATRLALEGARLAQARGFAVCWGAGGGAPAGPGALFADLPGRALFADLPGRALLDEVRAALLDAADGRPLFLLLDDLHAADATSLDLLLRLLREAEALRLVVVATCREDAVQAGSPIHAALALLDSSGLARGLHVPRLPLAGTRALLADLLEADPSEALAAAIHRATDGLPARVIRAAASRRAGPVPGEG